MHHANIIQNSHQNVHAKSTLASSIVIIIIMNSSKQVAHGISSFQRQDKRHIHSTHRHHSHHKASLPSPQEKKVKIEEEVERKNREITTSHKKKGPQQNEHNKDEDTAQR
jgi:hypothetical protein